MVWKRKRAVFPSAWMYVVLPLYFRVRNGKLTFYSVTDKSYREREIKSVLHVCVWVCVCVCVFTEADVYPGTVCHRLSCRKRPIISSHGSSGGVKCVICVGSNWQPTLVEADWGEGRAAVT